MKNIFLISLISLICCAACDSSSNGKDQLITNSSSHDGIPFINTGLAEQGIVYLDQFEGPLPDSIRKVFDRYTSVTAPNGKAIHLFAQSGWEDIQIIKARNVLEHILTDYEGSRFGDDKSAVANAIADRNGAMVLFDDEEALNEHIDRLDQLTGLNMQDLRANEAPAEGTADYMAHGTRDASFEEILHFVQDYGIRPVLPDYDNALMRANLAAVAAGAWDPWPDDEPESHHNEYYAVVYDNYLDLWKVKPTLYEGRPIKEGEIPSGQSHFGRYRLGDSRQIIREFDEDGVELIEDFFPPYLTYTPILPENFSGTFSITYDQDLRYTAKSQHLMNVQLSGIVGANLVGNEMDNRLIGNAGDNRLTGAQGNDYLNGGKGTDTVVLSGNRRQYSLWSDGERVTVRDCQSDRDGYDELADIELIAFRDNILSLTNVDDYSIGNGDCQAGPI